MKRISQQIRELQPSPGLACDGSFLFGWRQATDKAAELIEQLEDTGIIERGRNVTCGYCESLIYCTPEEPSEQDLADEQKAFVAHDAVCESNPLAKRVAELESERKELRSDKAELVEEVANLQSQLAWTPVEKGLPTEPGVYVFRRANNDVALYTRAPEGHWHNSASHQALIYEWRIAEWFVAYRRIELPEAK